MMSIPRNERDCTATNQKETGRERYRERARREAQDNQATGHERMMETDAQTTSKPSPQGHSRGTGERGRAEKGGQTLLMHFDFVCLGGGSFALLFLHGPGLFSTSSQTRRKLFCKLVVKTAQTY